MISKFLSKLKSILFKSAESSEISLNEEKKIVKSSKSSKAKTKTTTKTSPGVPGEPGVSMGSIWGRSPVRVPGSPFGGGPLFLGPQGPFLHKK